MGFWQPGQNRREGGNENDGLDLPITVSAQALRRCPGQQWAVAQTMAVVAKFAKSRLRLHLHAKQRAAVSCVAQGSASDVGFNDVVMVLGELLRSDGPLLWWRDGLMVTCTRRPS